MWERTPTSKSHAGHLCHHTSPMTWKVVFTLHYKQGYSIKKICQLLNIKKTLAYETLRLHQKFGVPYDPHARQQGLHPHCLTTTDLSFICALLNQQHTVYLDEIQEQLLSCYGVKVSIPTLMCTLRRLDFTNKDVLGKALKCSDHENVLWGGRGFQFSPSLHSTVSLHTTLLRVPWQPKSSFIFCASLWYLANPTSPVFFLKFRFPSPIPTQGLQCSYSQ